MSFQRAYQKPNYVLSEQYFFFRRYLINKIIFELNHVKGTETAMIFGEVYRHNNTWKFRAKGQGYAGGFKKMCDEYGAEY